MPKPSSTKRVETFIEFLQTIARGLDAKSQFEKWFPDFSNPYIGRAMDYLRGSMALPFWQSRSAPSPVLSKDCRQAYEEVFRHKVRIVWHRALVGDNNPQAAASHLRTEIRGFAQYIHIGTTTSLEPWCRKTNEALRWLEDNTHKLRMCAIANCKHPYFIATAYRKTYCSDICKETAEVERSKERSEKIAEAKRLAVIEGQGINKPRLTPDGRERIAKAARAQAARRRREKSRLKKH